LPNTKNRNSRQEKNKLNQTFHVPEKHSNFIENRSEKDRESIKFIKLVPTDNVSEIDTKSVKEKITDSKFNLNNTENQEQIPSSNYVTEQNTQVIDTFSSEKEQELISLRDKNTSLLREITDLKMSCNRFEKDLEIGIIHSYCRKK
jgi:hypothetical protein